MNTTPSNKKKSLPKAVTPNLTSSSSEEEPPVASKNKKRVDSSKQKAGRMKKQKVAKSPEHKFQVGTIVLKKFDGFGWYAGKVEELWFGKDGEAIYNVLYQDGDTEDLEEEDLEVFVKTARRKGITSMAPSNDPVLPLEADDSRSLARHILNKKLRDNEAALFKLKKEKNNKQKSADPLKSLPPESRAERKRWIKANKDPRTGQGRHVFRRATGPQKQKSIVEVLGGNGMDPWPVVKNAVNPHFVKQGEFFVAGRSDWNPWGPRFPGDDGLLNAAAFYENASAIEASEQTLFHLFEMCHKSKENTRYQGKDARGGYFYAGIYRRSESGVSMTVTLNMDGLDETRWAYADLMYRRQRRQTFFYTNDRGEVCQIDPSEVLREFSNKAAEVHEEDYPLWSEKKREIAAWSEMLYHYKYAVHIEPIEYVQYDEGLYDKLVAEGASKGQVAIRHEDLGVFHF